jgi:NADH-quinone oxidoreductase subunit G
LRAISAYLGHALPYDDLIQLRARMAEVNPVFATSGELRRLAGTDLTAPAGDPAALTPEPFALVFANYYQTDPISRASPTMAACVAVHYPALAEAAE